jgi:hypothetical protein
LAAGIRTLLDAGTNVYVTTDFGQPDVGDPYVASRVVLDSLATELGEDVAATVAVDNPRRLAERIVAGRPA